MLQDRSQGVHIGVVARSFQIRATDETFDHNLFREKVVVPVKQLLAQTGHLVQKLVIVTNADVRSAYAEEIAADGTTPTMRAVRAAFADDARVEAIACTDWGKNVGSGNALNVGDSYINGTTDLEFVLNWSPEMAVLPRHLYRAIDMMLDRPAMQVVGFYREMWWERTQWNIVQNTIALYRLSTLMAMGGFARKCDGDDGVMVQTEEYGPVLRAGMEDFHYVLRLLRRNREYRHGIVGLEAPLEWHVDFDPQSERGKNHLRKVARQYAVMREWCKDVFPEQDVYETLNQYFESRISQ